MLRKPERSLKKKNDILIAYAFGSVIYSSDTSGYITTVLKIDPKIINKIISGEIRGLSPEIRIRKWECSICHKNFEECSHEEGKLYNNKICKAIAKEIEFTGVSLVDHPADSRCRITDLLLITEEAGKRKYEWYGFRVDNENDRFKNIQRALEKGLISQNAAFSFSKFFLMKFEGKTSYPNSHGKI